MVWWYVHIGSSKTVHWTIRYNFLLVLKLYDWDLRNSQKLAQKWPKKLPLLVFFQFFFQKLSIFERSFLQSLYTIVGSILAMASNPYDWDLGNKAKISPKMTKKLANFGLFRFFQRLFTVRKNCYVFLYHLRDNLCNFIKPVWLEFERVRRKKT